MSGMTFTPLRLVSRISGWCALPSGVGGSTLIVGPAACGGGGGGGGEPAAANVGAATVAPSATTTDAMVSLRLLCATTARSAGFQEPLRANRPDPIWSFHLTRQFGHRR